MTHSLSDRKQGFYRELLDKIDFGREEEVRLVRKPLDVQIREGALAGPFLVDRMAWLEPDGRLSGRPSPRSERVAVYRPEDPPVDLGKFPDAERVVICLPGSPPGTEGVQARLLDCDADQIVLALPSAWKGKIPKRILLAEITAEFEQRLLKGMGVSPDWPRAAGGSAPEMASLSEVQVLMPSEDPSVHEALRLLLGENDFCGIKGPPGTGKTRLLARFAVEAIKRGFRVGIVSLSHRAVNNALNAVTDAFSRKSSPTSVYKLGGNRDGLDSSVKALAAKDFPASLSIWGGTVHAAAGLFKKDELASDAYFQSRRRDILIVDEAGQVPAAYLSALAYLSPRMMLFGDEDQLPPISSQPGKPVISGLQFLMQERGDAWIRSLLISHRLNAHLCHIIQKHYYPSLPLRAGANREAQIINLRHPPLAFIDVPHFHHTSRSDEEIEVIVRLVKDLLAREWKPGRGASRALTAKDIMVLSPFRVQVASLSAALDPCGMASQVGTVDRMQGQGAAVVILSLTASSPSYIANKCEWLFQPNRLNVAVSRAMALCVLVGNRQAIEESHPIALQGVVNRNAFLALLDDCHPLPPIKN